MFKFRNYDPETGAMRKHQRTDEKDTVEKQVEGLTEAAIAQEQQTRNQELVSTTIAISLRTGGERGGRAPSHRRISHPFALSLAVQRLTSHLTAGLDEYPT